MNFSKEIASLELLENFFFVLVEDFTVSSVHLSIFLYRNRFYCYNNGVFTKNMALFWSAFMLFKFGSSSLFQKTERNAKKLCKMGLLARYDILSPLWLTKIHLFMTTTAAAAAAAVCNITASACTQFNDGMLSICVCVCKFTRTL